MKKKPAPKLYVIAHNIRSLYNVGSIFRIADAFNLSKVYLTGYTGTPANPLNINRVAKSALGSEKWVPWEHHKSVTRVIKKLKEQGIQIVALENSIPKSLNSKLKPQDLKKFKAHYPIVLVLGEEVRGVREPILKLCDRAVYIPMFGKKESLNVSVAFGIAVYELTF